MPIYRVCGFKSRLRHHENTTRALRSGLFLYRHLYGFRFVILRANACFPFLRRVATFWTNSSMRSNWEGVSCSTAGPTIRVRRWLLAAQPCAWIGVGGGRACLTVGTLGENRVCTVAMGSYLSSATDCYPSFAGMKLVHEYGACERALCALIVQDGWMGTYRRECFWPVSYTGNEGWHPGSGDGEGAFQGDAGDRGDAFDIPARDDGGGRLERLGRYDVDGRRSHHACGMCSGGCLRFICRFRTLVRRGALRR